MPKENTGPIARWDVGSPVYSLAVSYSGTRVAYSTYDHHVRVWDVRTGALVLGPLKGHTNRVRCVAFSPDDTRICSASSDSTIRFWDAQTGAPIGEPLEEYTDEVNSVAFSHDSTLIVSGSGNRTLCVWDIRTGLPTGEPLNGHTDRIKSVAFSHDSTLIVSGSLDHTIRVWDARTGTPRGEPLQGHTAAVSSVAFSHDSTRIVSGSTDTTVRIWDARRGTAIGEPLEGHTNYVLSVAFSHDSTLIVSGSWDNTVRTWDARTGTPIGEQLNGHTNAVYSVAFSHNGTRIISGSSDSSIAVWPAPPNSPSGMETGESPLVAQVDDTLESVGTLEDAPSFNMVSSSMSIEEIFTCLVKHGCADLTSSLDAEHRPSAVIASGGFGDVRRVTLDDGTFVALKSLRLHILKTAGDKGTKRAVREVYLWSRLRHPHIQELLGIVVFQGGLGMVSPWREHGHLQGYIAAHPEVSRHPLCVQLASAVSYLHGIGMVHGDLKAINVLMADDGKVKISDFDYAILSDTTLRFSATTRAGGGTLRWMAPELFEVEDDDEDEDEDMGTDESPSKGIRTKQTDVYALGMTMLEIMTGTIPYSEYQSEGQIHRAIFKKKPPKRPKALSGTDEGAQQMWRLLLRCWDHDSSTRPDASSVLASLESFNA